MDKFVCMRLYAREAGKPCVLSEFGSRRRVCSEWKGDLSGTEQEGNRLSENSGHALEHLAQAEAGCMEREVLYEEVSVKVGQSYIWGGQFTFLRSCIAIRLYIFVLLTMLQHNTFH